MMSEFAFGTRKSPRMCAAGVSDHRGHETQTALPLSGQWRGGIHIFSLSSCLSANSRTAFLIPLLHSLSYPLSIYSLHIPLLVGIAQGELQLIYGRVDRWFGVRFADKVMRL
jgi:hypothetical protein